MKEKIIIVLDFSSRDQALRLVETLHDLAGMFKVGSQLYTAAGPSIVREIAGAGGKVFLDLKLHDIPNTVTKAAVEAAKLGVSMLTIHASGGRAMMRAVSKELQGRVIVVAVTVLTSLDGAALGEIGFERPVEDQVLRLALLAQDCAVDGVVCSPREIKMVRSVTKPELKIVTPGIRMPNQLLNDQQRIATPREAIAAGADYLVVGRAVTDCQNPRAALESLTESIEY